MRGSLGSRRSRARAHRDERLDGGTYTWRATGPAGMRRIAAASRWADDASSATTAWSRAAALTSRARVKIAQREFEAADRDAYDALELAGRIGGDLVVPLALERLAIAAAQTNNHLMAVRLSARRTQAAEVDGLRASRSWTMGTRPSSPDSEMLWERTRF